ncbi:MAG: tRNA-(ms[2]io[6]A)-hydroxylase [Bacteroidia bacterium]|nr:tRNA-(ms[2]io[6]A)-hydroxylase [Bacteroidia bacterium]
MKMSADLVAQSPPAWIEAVMADFDSFLPDHADAERKASAMAMSLIAKYPNRTEIIPDLIETALEELEHFQQVYSVMQERGIQLFHSVEPDLYVKSLLSRMDNGIEARFLDRLLIASVVECRGAERFRLVYEALPPGDLKKFYHMLWASEAKHGNVFVKMALNYFPENQVYTRLEEWVKIEAEVMQSLPIRARLH